MNGSDMNIKNIKNSIAVTPSSNYFKSPAPPPLAAAVLEGATTILPPNAPQQNLAAQHHQTNVVFHQEQYQPYQTYHHLHHHQHQHQQLSEYTSVAPTNHAVCISNPPPVSYYPPGGGYTTHTTTPPMAPPTMAPPTMAPPPAASVPHGYYVTSYYNPLQSPNPPPRQQQVYTYYSAAAGPAPATATATATETAQELANANANANANYITCSATGSPQLANTNSATVGNDSYSVATSSSHNYDDNAQKEDERYANQYKRIGREGVQVQEEQLPPAKRKKAIELDDEHSSDDEDENDDDALPSYTITYYSSPPAPPAHPPHSYSLQEQGYARYASAREDLPLPVSTNNCTKISFRTDTSHAALETLTNDDFEMPDHLDLTNYNTSGFIAARVPRAGCSEMTCVMCGHIRPCNKKGVTARCVFWIPNQNKGICTECDVSIWQIQANNGLIRWCKGCKNFRPWKCFGEKFFVTKCNPCREGQKERYKEKLLTGWTFHSSKKGKKRPSRSSRKGNGGLSALLAAAATDQF